MRTNILILTSIIAVSILLFPTTSSIPLIKPNLDGYGPCTINGTVGNGNLTVGLDEKGTIVLFSWPKAGYYDHVKYLAISEDLPNYGVKDNMGIFSGIIYTYKNEKKLSWLKSKDWVHKQYYQTDESNVLVTESINSNLKIKVVSTVFVLSDKDVLVQNFEIEVFENCDIENIQLIFFENFNICDYRLDGFPISDWLLDFFNDYKVFYDADINGICHFKPDKAFLKRIFNKENGKGTYISISGSTEPISYQCGRDFRKFGNYMDAYTDSFDKSLSMNDEAQGKVNSAMIFPLNFTNNKSDISIYFTASNYLERNREIIKETTSIGYKTLLNDTNAFWETWLSKANLPKNAPNKINRICKRSLILIRTCYDSKTGAIIASPSRQAPYSADWPRDGAFINYALDLAGYYKMVEKHNIFYTKVQNPSGRWDMCYYSDGVVAGPIPFEIDQIGYGLWGLYEHYEFTNDFEYLEKVYPSIKKSAMLLTYWRDPITKLHFPANEDDDWRFKQTLRGAANVLLGLKSAIKAGEVLQEDNELINKWHIRAQELEHAIDEYFWIENDHYTDARGGGSTLLWPMEYKDNNDSMMKSQINYLYNFLLKGREGGHDYYGYDIRTLSSIAYIWKNDTRLMDLMEWFSDIATPGTLFYGERFRISHSGDGISYENYISLPHIWTHALFYIAAMFMYS
jgi:GH15 family glucan-1,4-alpha-glucosidase